ncbi:hypothetical protein GW17_00006753 [Ensete ventricosum]|nr:hypothetical protein GW17_00006753 [Ensete ventricosum]
MPCLVIGTRTARYRVVPPKIDCWRWISGEINHWRSIEEEKGKKKKKRKRRKKNKNLLSMRRPRPRVAAALACWRFFSRARRWNVSPCGEKDRGDVTPFF